MLIRSFAEDDCDALRELWRATWGDAYATRLGPGAACAIDESLAGDAVKSMFADDGGCFVAVEGPQISGSLCFAERGDVAYVWGMYVRPHRQRSGVGTALLGHAARAFRSAEWVDLSAVDERALQFYRKLGFAEQGPGEVELFPNVRVTATRLVAAVRDLRLNPSL